jgi:hypothetical protein
MMMMMMMILMKTKHIEYVEKIIEFLKLQQMVRIVTTGI